jgi:hypothetical protein
MVAQSRGILGDKMNPAPWDEANKTVGSLADACNIAKEAANQAPRCLGPNPDQRMRQKVLIQFRHGVFPTRRPGRKRKEVVTAAYCDWKKGLRGPEFYQKHIPNYAAHNRYRREAEARRLMSASR